MDSETLVKSSQELTRLLDDTRVKPRVVFIAEIPETSSRRIWIVPSNQIKDKSEFFGIVAKTISENRSTLSGIDVGLIDFKKENDKAIGALSFMLRMEGVGSAFLNSNRVNGILLPDGIAIRVT